MSEIITEYPHFFTATNLNWKKLLEPDKYKDVIIFAVVGSLLKAARHCWNAAEPSGWRSNKSNMRNPTGNLLVGHAQFQRLIPTRACYFPETFLNNEKGNLNFVLG